MRIFKSLAAKLFAIFIVSFQLTGLMVYAQGTIDSSSTNPTHFKMSDAAEFCVRFNLFPIEPKATQLLIGVQNLPAGGLGSVTMIIKGPFGYFREFMLNSIPNDLSTVTCGYRYPLRLVKTWQ